MLGGNVTALTLTQNAATVDCEVKPKIYDLWTEQNWIFLSLIVIEFSHHFPLHLRNPYSFGLKPFEINKKVVMVENWTRGSSVRGDYKRYVSKFSKSILKGCKGAHSKWKNVFCEKSIDSTHFLHFWLSVTEAFHLVSVPFRPKQKKGELDQRHYVDGRLQTSEGDTKQILQCLETVSVLTNSFLIRISNTHYFLNGF